MSYASTYAIVLPQTELSGYSVLISSPNLSNFGILNMAIRL